MELAGENLQALYLGLCIWFIWFGKYGISSSVNLVQNQNMVQFQYMPKYFGTVSVRKLTKVDAN
jgi:hypothetical protein